MTNAGVTCGARKSGIGLSLRDILLIGVLFTLTFDYRRAEGDAGGMVVIMGLSNLACGAAFIAMQRFYNRNVLLFILPFLIFLLQASIVGIARGQAPISVLSQAMPILVFAQAALVCASYPRSVEELRRLLTWIVVSGIAAASWKLLFALSYYELTLETVRYQVLSGATGLLFSYSLASFLTGSRRFMWVALLLSLGVVFVAVTRTYIVMFFSATFVTFLSLPISVIVRRVVRLIRFVVAAAIALMVVEIAMPELGARWTGRLSHRSEVGVDITALTRIAETKGQIKRMQEDPLGLVFGFGILGEMKWADEEVSIVQSIIGGSGGEFGRGYGHNFYVGSVFVGGAVFGTLMLITIAAIPLRAMGKLSKIFGNAEKEEVFLGTFAIAASACYFFFGFLGGTLGDRSMSLYYGAATGLCLNFIFMPTFLRRSIQVTRRPEVD